MFSSQSGVNFEIQAYIPEGLMKICGYNVLLAVMLEMEHCKILEVFSVEYLLFIVLCLLLTYFNQFKYSI